MHKGNWGVVRVYRWDTVLFLGCLILLIPKRWWALYFLFCGPQNSCGEKKYPQAQSSKSYSTFHSWELHNFMKLLHQGKKIVLLLKKKNVQQMYVLKLSKTQASLWALLYGENGKIASTVTVMERNTNISTLKDHSSLAYQLHLESLEYRPDAEWVTSDEYVLISPEVPLIQWPTEVCSLWNLDFLPWTSLGKFQFTLTTVLQGHSFRRDGHWLFCN